MFIGCSINQKAGSDKSSDKTYAKLPWLQVFTGSQGSYW